MWKLYNFLHHANVFIVEDNILYFILWNIKGGYKSCRFWLILKTNVYIHVLYFTYGLQLLFCFLFNFKFKTISHTWALVLR